MTSINPDTRQSTRPGAGKNKRYAALQDNQGHAAVQDKQGHAAKKAKKCDGKQSKNLDVARTAPAAAAAAELGTPENTAEGRGNETNSLYVALTSLKELMNDQKQSFAEQNASLVKQLQEQKAAAAELQAATNATKEVELKAKELEMSAKGAADTAESKKALIAKWVSQKKLTQSRHESELNGVKAQLNGVEEQLATALQEIATLHEKTAQSMQENADQIEKLEREVVVLKKDLCDHEQAAQHALDPAAEDAEDAEDAEGGGGGGGGGGSGRGSGRGKARLTREEGQQYSNPRGSDGRPIHVDNYSFKDGPIEGATSAEDYKKMVHKALRDGGMTSAKSISPDATNCPITTALIPKAPWTEGNVRECAVFCAEAKIADFPEGVKTLKHFLAVLGWSDRAQPNQEWANSKDPIDMAIMQKAYRLAVNCKKLCEAMKWNKREIVVVVEGAETLVPAPAPDPAPAPAHEPEPEPASAYDLAFESAIASVSDPI